MDTKKIFELIVDEFGADVIHDELMRLYPATIKDGLDQICERLEINLDDATLIIEE